MKQTRGAVPRGAKDRSAPPARWAPGSRRSWLFPKVSMGKPSLAGKFVVEAEDGVLRHRCFAGEVPDEKCFLMSRVDEARRHVGSGSRHVVKRFAGVARDGDAVWCQNGETAVRHFHG